MRFSSSARRAQVSRGTLAAICRSILARFGAPNGAGAGGSSGGLMAFTGQETRGGLLELDQALLFWNWQVDPTIP